VCSVLDLQFQGWLLPLMQAVSLAWSCPSAAGIAPVFLDETGAGALSRPARPEAWAHGARIGPPERP